MLPTIHILCCTVGDNIELVLYVVYYIHILCCTVGYNIELVLYVVYYSHTVLYCRIQY